MRLKLETQVKLTDERIRQLDSRSTKQYRQWVGVVVGYRPGAECPLVEFDADEERRSEILQDVAPAYLIVLSVYKRKTLSGCQKFSDRFEGGLSSGTTVLQPLTHILHRSKAGKPPNCL